MSTEPVTACSQVARRWNNSDKAVAVERAATGLGHKRAPVLSLCGRQANVGGHRPPLQIRKRTGSQQKEIIRARQIEVCFRLESKDFNGQLAMFEFTVPAVAKVPTPHSHTLRQSHPWSGRRDDFTIDRQPVDIAAGDTCFIPRGAVHVFNNLKQAAAKPLTVAAPKLIGPEGFQELAATVNAGSPPDTEKIIPAITRHGLVRALPRSHQFPWDCEHRLILYDGGTSHARMDEKHLNTKPESPPIDLR